MRRLALILVAGSVIAGAQAAEAAPKVTKYHLSFITAMTVIPAGQCRSIEKVMEGKSIVLGITATRFTQKLTYCWDWTKKKGHHLTKVQWTTGLYVAPWWDVFGEYVGVVGQSEWGGVGQNIAGRWQRGHFKVCVPWVNACQNTYPWTQVEAYGRGGYNTQGGT
jgi:hypothetical protein